MLSRNPVATLGDDAFEPMGVLEQGRAVDNVDMLGQLNAALGIANGEKGLTTVLPCLGAEILAVELYS